MADTIDLMHKFVDGEVINRTYKTIKGAVGYVKKAVGDQPFDVYDRCAITGSGSEIFWSGCTPEELFPGIEIKTENPSKGEEKMDNMNDVNEKIVIGALIENFVIGSRDAKLQMGTLRKAKPAVDAVEGVPAVKAEVDKDGNVIKEAVKAVKAVAAKPATVQEQEVHLDSVSEIVMGQVRARMAALGFMDKFEGQAIIHGSHFRLTYVASDAKLIRAAFKEVKSKDGHNAPGLKILADAKKAADKEAADAAKKAKDAGPVDPEKKTKGSGKTKTKDTEKVEPAGVVEEDDEWPGEDELEGFDS